MGDREFCQVRREGRVMTVTLNRPDVMNALHPPAHFELGEVFDEFANDPDLWIAVLTGAGERAFCAGFDLKYRAEAGRDTGVGDFPETGFAGLTGRFDLNKPVIAAVNGLALGGGFETVLACDLVIAAENAYFSLPEPRVGLAAIGGAGVHRLPRQIGMKPAMGMLLTGRRVSADEALNLGMINEVVPAADLMAAANRWVDQILECSPMSIRATKEAALQGLRMSDIADAFNTDFPAVTAMRESDDIIEGPAAFAEKRKPSWKGK
jgi:enoyl-CoA hydratase/carnithine racemase